MKSLSVSSSTARVNLGPFSTSLRVGALAVGGLAIATRKATPAILSAAEAVVTLTGGAGAAAGVGVLALAQGAGVARLGLADLADALGGSEQAAKRLTPEVRDLFNTLADRQKELRGSAQEGMLPGLTKGAERALRNFRVLNRVTKTTARTLGGLAADAGGMAGSRGWGRDLQTLGATNVKILNDLGHAGLNLTDAARHVAVEAGPLTEWLADSARDGARFVEVWAQSARASGDMARFFKDARTELTLLGSATGHGTRGLINLFGNQDVDGTKTLENLDRIMGRFERWTSSPAVREDIGQALVDEFVDLGGRAAGALATGMVHAAPTAAGMFIDAFMEADAWGKLLVGGWLAKKLGGFKALGGLLGRAGGGGGPLGLTGKGSSPANPLWVADVSSSLSGAAPGSKLGKIGSRLGAAGRAAGAATGATAVGALAYEEALAYHQANMNRPGRGQPNPIAPNTYTGPFGFIQKQVYDLLGGGGEKKPEKGKPPIIENDITLMIDGVPFARLQANTEARRRARQAGPLAGP